MIIGGGGGRRERGEMGGNGGKWGEMGGNGGNFSMPKSAEAIFFWAPLSLKSVSSAFTVGVGSGSSLGGGRLRQ